MTLFMNFMMKKGLWCLILFFFCALSEAAVVQVKKSADGWRLLVDQKPFMVKGMVYSPCKVGESPNTNTMRDWMVVDDDQDGRNDFAYQSWIDSNRNNTRDENETEVGDFQLMKDMGVNTIRVYHHPSNHPDVVALNPGRVLISHAPNKKLLRTLHRDYGIWVMMGDLLGAYTVSSGAEWEDGTDYRDPQQRANMLKSVEAMIEEFKDEPYILLWTLGNENNFTQYTQNNSTQYPEEYAEFVNEVARRIHALDPDHPVVLVNGETKLLNLYNKYTPDVDILGINSYRYGPGFGSLWKEVVKQYDKPVLLTEYGTGYPPVDRKTRKMKEKQQAQMHKDSWLDIANHAAGEKPPGNAIGGFAFEWLDNWWQSWNEGQQDLKDDGWHHEFNGICSQGDGRHSPLLRDVREVYDMYQQLWNEMKENEEI